MLADAVAEARVFPTTFDAVGEMDSWIEDVGARWKIDQRLLFRARVCVSELAANAIEHGQVQSAPDGIHLELRIKPPLFEIEISDPGALFDPTAAATVADDDDRIGGRGLRLVRSYAKATSYRRSQGRNILTLQFAAAP